MAGKYHTEETRAKVIKAHQSGQFSLGEISRHYGIPRETVRGWCVEDRPVRQKNTKAELWQAIDGVAPKSAAPSFVADVSKMEITTPRQGKRIIVIPDVQAKPGLDFTFLSHVGRYIAEKRPDIIVNIGDFADMPSLSSHDLPGSKSTELRRYALDIEAVQEAMLALMTPIREAKKTGWNPRMVFTLGNHEHRINRALEANPKLLGTIQMDDLRYEDWGWEVHPFLRPVIIEGIAFCHYFQTGQMGRPASSARAILNKQHMSAFAGHQQGRDIAYGKRGDGREMTAIICGSCYEHDEEYLSPQTNNHFRGLYVLNDVDDGSFEEMPVSLKYLRRKYSA